VNAPPFQQLLDAHGADLHRFCLAQAGPHHGPDCFQEAVLSALRAQQLIKGCTPRVAGTHNAPTMAQMEVAAGQVSRSADLMPPVTNP